MLSAGAMLITVLNMFPSKIYMTSMGPAEIIQNKKYIVIYNSNCILLYVGMGLMIDFQRLTALAVVKSSFYGETHQSNFLLCVNFWKNNTLWNSFKVSFDILMRNQLKFQPLFLFMI